MTSPFDRTAAVAAMTAHVCTQVADLFESDPRKWTQNTYQVIRYCGDGMIVNAYCLVGAIEMVVQRAEPADGPWRRLDVVTALSRTLGGVPDLEGWNDDPHRTRLEVIALLRATAAEARVTAERPDPFDRIVAGLMSAKDRAARRSRDCVHRLSVAASHGTWRDAEGGYDVEITDEMIQRELLSGRERAAA